MNTQEYLDQLYEQRGRSFAMCVRQIGWGIALGKLATGLQANEVQKESLVTELTEFNIANAMLLQEVSGFDGATLRDAVDTFVHTVLAEAIASRATKH